MLYLILIVGLITAYINGMHDGGTIVATTITSRIMTPRKAIVISGLANLVGALFLGTTVALTVSQGMETTSSFFSSLIALTPPAILPIGLTSSSEKHMHLPFLVTMITLFVPEVSLMSIS